MVYQCSICQEAWPLKAKPKSPSSYICRRCSLDKQSPKLFSAENFIIPSCVPEVLQGLTQIEEMLIARALPIMKVYIKPGGQRGYSGHCINLPQKVTDLAKSLPRCPKDIPVVVVTMKGKDNTFKDVFVRKNKVEQALEWLIKHNPHYHDVKLDTNLLDTLPVNGIITYKLLKQSQIQRELVLINMFCMKRLTISVLKMKIMCLMRKQKQVLFFLRVP